MDFATAITRLPIAEDRARGADIRALFAELPGPLADLIEGAAGSSPYLAQLLRREAEWLPGAFGRINSVVADETAGFEALDANALGPALRQAKRRVALISALADLAGVWQLEQVTGALSDLAGRAADLALQAHLAREIARGKMPQCDADAGGLVALAMGKMGADELNYSSDIDLVMLYDDSAYDPDDLHEARAGLIRVTRRMAATLSDNTEHGYVFRTDLRLRPDAAVTPVCMSISAALAYYEAEGRTWERAAYIKARPCAGDLTAGARFLDELRPFVWRKHLDFAAIQDAHDMRLRIREHKGLGGKIELPGHNMKLGTGGIREIEFFAQTRQLIAGGRDPDLRLRATVPALKALAEKGWIPRDVADELAAHYRAHRDVEHRIQMVNDAQTHDLPRDAEGIRRIAFLSGARDCDSWSADLVARLERVETLTDAFFAPEEAAEMPDLRPETAAMIERWHGYNAMRSERAQELFRRILPDLVGRMQRAAHPEDAFQRFDGFLSGLPAGVQLFALFEANPQLIDLIVDICATAPGLANYLSRHANVLDAVLGGSFFDAWPGVQALTGELSALLAEINGGYERALDAARRWTHEWQFRVGVHHLRGLIDGLEAGAQYADIAEAALAALFPVVADDFARRHGPPPGRGAVVLGMGSLGARRLNAGSDLDLIVIYDGAGAEGSDGPRPLLLRPYYARLTQALITALSAPTAEGRLYEVDMRLRPSGRQGPVATAFASFGDYQRNEAWTWEHLALTRARVVAGCGGQHHALGADLEALRRDILAECGEPAQVIADLSDMRDRLFAAKAPDGAWDAKIGRGRLQDIELLAQSVALRGAFPAHGPEAQLRAGRQRGMLSVDQAEPLTSAIRFLARLNIAARLLSEKPLDLDEIGQGGQALLLRECDCQDIEALAARLATHIQTAAAIIDDCVQGAKRVS